MLSLTLHADLTSPVKILCLGAHSDDIEIGCGGMILSLARRYPNCVFHWVVFSAHGVRAAEAQRAAELFGGTNLFQEPLLREFQDGFMPFVGAEVKATFQELKAICPDLILTHNRKDAHQDHRLISELTGQTFRDHLILEYEIPKYDGDIGQPNLYMPLEQQACEKKVHYLTDVFRSQHTKCWFRPDTFLALMRLRGVECNSPSGYAEAFYCHKLVLECIGKGGY
jgi:LmbE family N-acetylglucosaminyl deacetylase